MRCYIRALMGSSDELVHKVYLDLKVHQEVLDYRYEERSARVAEVY